MFIFLQLHTIGVPPQDMQMLIQFMHFTFLG